MWQEKKVFENLLVEVHRLLGCLAGLDGVAEVVSQLALLNPEPVISLIALNFLNINGNLLLAHLSEPLARRENRQAEVDAEHLGRSHIEPGLAAEESLLGERVGHRYCGAVSPFLEGELLFLQRYVLVEQLHGDIAIKAVFLSERLLGHCLGVKIVVEALLDVQLGIRAGAQLEAQGVVGQLDVSLGRAHLVGHVHDMQRIDYLHRYLLELHRAMEEGIPVIGYTCWSAIDNLEWNSGYEKRFGLIFVDYRTMKRTIKDSGFWYRDVIESNGESLF